MILSNCRNLLLQAHSVNQHYKKINEITGENFNVFRILKVDSSEVRMHSALLAELLSPKGDHGQGDVFLRLFIERFCFKNSTYNTSTCSTSVEYHTEYISSDLTEGGRIDILITDDLNNQILIENKIYAKDQNKQMVRYRNYNPKADLFYLTLHGSRPSENSQDVLEMDKDFKCLSYKTDIINWLEQCRKEVATNPIVRESITQYINLIKFLTNQTINHNMEIELNALIKSNIEAAFTISDNLDNALNEVLTALNGRLEKMAEQLGLRLEASVDFEHRYTGFWFYKDVWKSVSIGFQFQNYDKELIYGFCAQEDPKNISSELRQSLSTLPNNSTKKNDWWAWFRPMEHPYSDWRKLEAWKAVEDGSMENIMKQKIEQLLITAKGLEL